MTGRGNEGRDNADVEIVSVETGFEGFCRLDIYRYRHRRQDGSWSGILEREVVRRADSIAVLPYDAKRDRVILIRQCRVSMLAAGCDPWSYECIAGGIDPGEDPEAAALRETREEAGCEVGRMENPHSFIVDPGTARDRANVFCAEVDSSSVPSRGGIGEEDIMVLNLPYAEAWKLVEDGLIDNATTMVAMLWLHQNRERLRVEWS